MPFEIITPGGGTSATPNPAAPAPGKPVTPAESGMAGKDAVSLADALKGADHTKITQFSVSDMSGKGGPAGSGGPGIGSPGSSVPLGGLVQGKVVVELMDSLIPSLLVLVFYKLEIVTKKSDFQLSQGEKNTLAPIVEACLNSINLNFDSPWTTLLVSLGIIYGGKAMERGGIAFIDKKADESRPVDPGKHDKPKAGFKPMAPAPNPTPDSTNTDSFKAPAGLPAWTEADVKAVEFKKKKGRAAAIDWLNKYWVKKGGVI